MKLVEKWRTFLVDDIGRDPNSSDKAQAKTMSPQPKIKPERTHI